MENVRPRRVHEIVEIFWRKKSLLILMMLAMLIANLVVIKRVPYNYESSSMILIGKQASDDQRVQHGPRFSALVDQISSRDHIQQLIRKYDLYPNIKETEDAVNAFQKDLRDLRAATKIRDFYPNVPESIKITFKHRDPVKAHQVVTDITNAFLQTNSAMKQEASAEWQRLNQKIGEVEAELRKIGPQKDINQLRMELLTRRTADLGVGGGMAGTRLATEQTIEALRDEKMRLEFQIEQLKSDIADQEKIANQVASAPSSTSSAAIGSLLGKKAEIQARIDVGINKGYLEKHPDMIRFRSELAQIDQQIAALESKSQAGSNQKLLLPEFRELRKMQRDLVSLQNQLELTDRKIASRTEALQKMPRESGLASREATIGQDINQADRTQYEQLLAQYQWLLGKRDEFERISNADLNSPIMYQVTEQPNLPQFPTAPNKLALMLIGLGLAFAFGLLIAFGTEIPRFFQINDERDVQYYLGAPVLASIPETLTPLERSYRRKISMTRGVLMLVLTVALVPAFIFILNASKVFHILGSR